MGPESFWVFNAQICILPHSRDSISLIFDSKFNTKKLIKIVHYNALQLIFRYFYAITPFAILHLMKKLCL